MANEKPTALVVGGTSGLGLELARMLAADHYDQVYVTGRHRPEAPELMYYRLGFSGNTDRAELSAKLGTLVARLPELDLLVCAAGFEERKTVGDFTDEDVFGALAVNLIAPMFLVPRILRAQRVLPGFIAITSTSQQKPRLHEANYCAAKAGLAMYANCVSLDGHVGRVLVAAPSGMNTPFWRERPRPDAVHLLDPTWVAERIMDEYAADDYTKFKMALILRDPPRVQVEEKR
jgi:NAD(P)-dependent dehydrogenase (short-subunit alcohol dehydrogenase family)